MIKLFAEIELLSGNNNKYNTAICNINGIENSAEISEILGKSVSAVNPFIIGEDFYNRTLEQKLQYFHGSIYSNDYGLFEKSYEIEFTTKDFIDTFFISFDTYNRAYPKQIELHAEVDGVMTFIGNFKDDDVQWEFKLAKSTKRVKFKVYEWSMPNKPFVVTGIYSDLKLTLDYTKITDISCGIVTQAEFVKPSYGIVSNSGTISFNDFYNEISDYIELGLLKEGALVNIWIENSLIPSQKYKVSEMYTDKWTYDEENKSVTVSLVDGLERLQDVEFEGIEYFPRVSQPKSYNSILNILKEKTKYIGFKVKITGDISAYLIGFTNPFPYMASSSLWSAWQKFGEATKTHIYKNSNGEITLHF